MRISDWNSDVCSSDLKYQRASAAVDIFAHAVGERQARRVVHGIAGHRRLNLVIDVADQDQFIDALADIDAETVVPVGRGSIGDVGIPSECADLLVETGSDHIDVGARLVGDGRGVRSEEHTSELQSLMRISYAV